MLITQSKWLLILLWASVSSVTMAQNQSEAEGFIEDSHVGLFMRNFYFNRDFRSDYGPGNVGQEWAQGLTLSFRSGYTQGLFGFGVDTFANIGLKLDGGAGRPPLLLLARDSNGNPENEYSEVGAALKMRLSDTELKAGDLAPYNPVMAIATSRLFPASTKGLQVVSSDIPGLRLDAGHFTSGNDVNSTNRDGPLKAFYAQRDASSIDYVGGWYKVNSQLTLGAFAANYADIWNQYYLSAALNLPINDLQAIGLQLTAYHTDDSGKSIAGNINNTTWSAELAYSVGIQKFTLARQQVHGDEPFDYLGFASMPGDAIGFLANKAQNLDFNLPHERSWQLRYNLDLVSFGAPGLTFMARYITSEGIDGSHYGGGAYSRYQTVTDGSRWERDLEVAYVVQSGPAKDLVFRVGQSTHRADASVQRVDLPSLDETRVTIEYPLSF
jgi:imipenem/basic amino acid-specific outer membrane pore